MGLTTKLTDRRNLTSEKRPTRRNKSQAQTGCSDLVRRCDSHGLKSSLTKTSELSATVAMPYAGKVTAKHAKFTNRITAVRGTISIGPQKATKATKMRIFVAFVAFCSKLRALAVSARPNVP